MTLIAQWRARSRASEIAARRVAYTEHEDGAARDRWQLEAWNAEWQRILAEVPYYRVLANRLSLPDRFESLAQFVALVPPLTRSTVQEEPQSLTSSSRGPEFWRGTGGSTAQPVRLPAWRSEVQATRPDMWVGRGWYGITPASRLFLIWGHSHRLRPGLRGWAAARKRELQDRMLGYRRISAYDLQPTAMRDAGAALLGSGSDYLMGYAVGLDRFAEANIDQTEAFRALRLRAVIGTGEGFPDGAPDRLAQLFGCPVAMEYGAVETGLLAHTHPEGGFRAFWRSYLLDAERSPHGGHVLRVTSLFPRSMPLVRYEIGDEIVPLDPQADQVVGVAAFERVRGRLNDYVELSDGTRIHSTAFAYAVRTAPEIRSFQVVHGPAGLRIRFTADGPLPERSALDIVDRLRRLHPQLATATFEPVDALEQTVAGKTRMIVIEQ